MMRITINDWHFLHADLLAIIGSLSFNYDEQMEQRKIRGFKCLFHLYLLCYLYIQYVVVLMQTCFSCSIMQISLQSAMWEVFVSYL